MKRVSDVPAIITDGAFGIARREILLTKMAKSQENKTKGLLSTIIDYY